MESREPITAELRRECVSSVQRAEVSVLSGEPVIETTLVIDGKVFDSLCDAIDAVHAGLERENAELRQRVAVLDESADSMHDGGSITDELRKLTTDPLLGYASQEVHAERLLAIADRIDAEHEAACAEAYGNGVMSVPIALDESAWVELPKDADGVPIHIGDVMAYADNTKPMEAVALVPPAVFLTEDGPRYADMCRHYHAPTVEDVLREFSCVLMGKREFDGDVAEAISEYAKRLTLAGDAE